MSSQSFKNIRTLQDIKLEKAKIRYEMLIAENRLLDSFNAVEKLVTIVSFFRRFAAGFAYAQHFISNFHKYLEKLMFWKKDKNEESEEDEKN
ncbi:MAG: hypothetical protein K0B37_11700 [Bacteroidales bacterium]|nr:hypothetical protein [Bacteroidales bacterium]